MDIFKLKSNPDKVRGLGKKDLEHIMFLIDCELQRYENVCRNYTKEKYEKYAIPYMESFRKLKEICEGSITSSDLSQS